MEWLALYGTSLDPRIRSRSVTDLSIVQTLSRRLGYDLSMLVVKICLKIVGLRTRTQFTGTLSLSSSCLSSLSPSSFAFSLSLSLSPLCSLHHSRSLSVIAVQRAEIQADIAVIRRQRLLKHFSGVRERSNEDEID